MNSEVTPVRKVSLASRLLHNGAHDGDLQIRDLVVGDGGVIHLRKPHVSIGNFISSSVVWE